MSAKLDSSGTEFIMSDPRNIAAFVNTLESSQLGRWTVLVEISCAVPIRITVLKKLKL